MRTMTADKYREMFKKRATGELDDMECTKRLFKMLKPMSERFKKAGLPLRVLDVGCGVGHYYHKLRELGNTYYVGVDVDKAAIDMARKIWRDDKNRPEEDKTVTFYHMSIEDTELPLLTHSFDVVICYNVLLHQPGFKKLLNLCIENARERVIIRSLFAEKHKRFTIVNDPSYMDVYPRKRIYYNHFAFKDVERYLQTTWTSPEGYGVASWTWTPDHLNPMTKKIGELSKMLKVKPKELTNGNCFRGHHLNYFILDIRLRLDDRTTDRHGKFTSTPRRAA